jgi:hypothetical protein
MARTFRVMARTFRVMARSFRVMAGAGRPPTTFLAPHGKRRVHGRPAPAMTHETASSTAAVTQITDKAQTVWHPAISDQARRGAMPFNTGTCSIYVALALAGAAAVLSTPGQAVCARDTLQFLFSTSAPEAAEMAGAIGANPDSFVSP